METILNEIRIERIRQVDQCKHGGDTEKFDESNTRNDWVAYISAYSGRAADKVDRNEKEYNDFRINMIKVATLAIADIEAHDKEFC